MSSPRLPPGTPREVASLIEEAGASERNADRTRARELYEAALVEAHSTLDPSLAASIIRWIGRSYLDRGDADAAEDCFEAALAVAEATGDPGATARAVNCQALVHHTRGRLDRAEILYRRSREAAQAAGDDKLVAMLDQNLGIVADIRGNRDLALEHFRACLETYRRLGLSEYKGPLLNNIGRLLTDARRFAEAERSLVEAYESCVLHGQISYQVLAHVNRTRLGIARNDYTKAREACDAAFELAHSSGDANWVGDIQHQYGTIFRATGKHRLALDALRRAEKIAEEQDDLLLAAETATELAEVFRQLNENPETLQQLNRAHRLFTELRARRKLADVGRRISRLEETFLRIVQEWGESIESKDRYTQGHCERVADYACALAEVDDFDPSLLIWFRMGALLHDVGKVAVPSEVLNKAGGLTDEEWEIMKSHAAVGAELLSGTEFPWDVTPMVRHHHERWDGKGYPDGLAGSDIPRSAQLLSIADVFDALTTDRSYRTAMTVSQALAILEKDAGTAFDPGLVGKFVGLVRDGRCRPPMSELGAAELAADATASADRVGVTLTGF